MSDGVLQLPLVSAEIDLRDFAFMPLDVLRLRDSELACVEDAEVFRCAVLSWCVAWHQVPAASLPDDDAQLARLLGFGRDVKGWKRIRSAGGMRGWVACSDGRIYHPVVAEKALSAWSAKLAQRARTEAARKAREDARQRQSQSLSQTTGSSVTETVTESKGEGQGEGQGEEKKKKPSASSARPTIPCPYERIVELYHEKLPALPRAKLMPKDRQASLRKLWGWVLSSAKSDGSRRAETADEALAWIAGYFARASENDFLMGRTPRAGEHANWRCDIDFLLTDKGMRHVIEKTQEAA